MRNIIQQIAQHYDAVMQTSQKLLNEGELTYDGAFTLTSFFNTYQHTNDVVDYAEKELLTDAVALSKDAAKLEAKAEAFISLYSAHQTLFDRFSAEPLCDAHMKPFDDRLKAQQAICHTLWMDYIGLSNQLDLGTYQGNEFDTMMVECDRRKAEYDKARELNEQLYKAQREELHKTAPVCYFRFSHLHVLSVKLRDIAKAIQAEVCI